MKSTRSRRPHPAAIYEHEVRAVQHRARSASIALGATMGARLLCLGLAAWQYTLVGQARSREQVAQEALIRSQDVIAIGKIGFLVVLATTTIFFFRWLYGLTALARALNANRLRWTPREAVQSFFIPFVNLVRPSQVLRDVHDCLSPSDIPEPRERVSADGAGGYRQLKVITPPPPFHLPPASVEAWWGAFWVARFLSRAGQDASHTMDGIATADLFSIAIGLVDVIAAALAIVMVRGMTARLLERFRRLRHNSPRALREIGIEIVPPWSREP
jgi:hypothetical protein